MQGSPRTEQELETVTVECMALSEFACASIANNLEEHSEGVPAAPGNTAINYNTPDACSARSKAASVGGTRSAESYP
jgi:hypothetical protein